VADLIEQNAEVTVLREFMLAQKALDTARTAKSQFVPMAACSGDYVMGDNDTDYPIPEFNWVHSDIEIGEAPLAARVTCLDVHYEITHSYIEDLAVDLCDENICVEYHLWSHEGGSGDSINETVTGITDFAGAPANQVWGLWALDAAEQDTGYVDSWWIKVYYTTPSAPDNDRCSDAAVIQDGVAYQGAMDGATGNLETRCSKYCDPYDVWHVFTATRTGLVTLSADSSDFDPTLAVFAQCGGEELACNDDAWEGTNSQITLRTTAGESYYIRVAACFWGFGDYTLTVQQSPFLLPEEPHAPSPSDGGQTDPAKTVLSWNDSVDLVVRLSAETPRETSQVVEPKAIYGRDDRMEEYQVTDSAYLAAGDSTVLLMPWRDLKDNGDNTYTVPPETLARVFEDSTGDTLCPDEPFRNQPAPGWCSGVLVAPDLVATAGHCVEAPISDRAAVFGFVMRDSETPVLTLEADDVYRCADVVAYQEGSPDWSLIRLQRRVVGREPRRLRLTGTVSDGQELLVVGHPRGIPRKYDTGSTVLDNDVNVYFQANSDTYRASSGSPAFNLDSMEVEGLIVVGKDDFVEDPQEGCYRSQVYSDDGPSWERFTRATVFSDVVPCFDVYLGTSPESLQLVTACSPAPWHAPGTLNANSVYYWRVVARNISGEVEGPLWSFSTVTNIVACDWNGDGLVSIVGDVPPFVDCVYFGNCPSDVDLLAVGDCNEDGILSIIGDVPCFVDCVYFGDCPD
jgi:hypothetical protein